jgi:hypothetical protein
MATSFNFKLEFCGDCLRLLNAAAVRAEKAMAKERAAFDAGRLLASGKASRALFLAIANWKSARRRALLEENSLPALRAVMNMVRGNAPTSEKLVALTGLRGVGVPMATAILTAMYPDDYLVLDVRTLDALGERGRQPTAELYEAFLSFCRTAANEAGMPLRDFDRALWKAGSA